ncbi:MAG: ABC transporter ATP-binding protein [Planctomycetota bacterium]
MIEIANVHKGFGSREILRGLDLTIAAGETFVIIGRSGIGKSVTLRHIVGLLHPDTGTVRVFGTDLATLDERELLAHRRRIGYLFQDGALLNWLNIEDNVALPLREHGEGSPKEVLEKVHSTLDMVELREHRHKKPNEISGGMRKRAGLARALVTDPKIVLYDEPTSGLDPISSSIINQLVRDLQARLGICQVIVTHDMHSAYTIADRIGLLHEGTLQAVGTPDDIRNSDREAVIQFVEGKIDGPLSHHQRTPSG